MRRTALSAALALGVALLSAARLPAPPLPAGTTTGLTALEKYLVDDVAFVGVANVKAVAASPLYARVKKEVAALAEHEFLAKYFKPVGVKPLRDVERVVMVMGQEKAREYQDKKGKGPEYEDRTYFLFQGKFDEKKFEAGLARIAKEDRDTRLHGKGSAAVLAFNDDTFFALVDRSTVVMASSKEVVEAVRARGTGKVKAKFKVKDFPAALKSLKAGAAIDAVGFGAMTIDTEFETLGQDGYKITPVTLDRLGFKKLTVRVEMKDELRGKVVFEGNGKAGFAAAARKLEDGFEREKKDTEERAKDDPLEKAVLAVLKAARVTTGEQAVTFEGALAQAAVKTFLELLKKELDEAAPPPAFDKKK